MIAPLGILLVAIVTLLLLRGRDLGIAIGLTSALTAGSLAKVGGFDIPVFYAMGIVAAVVILLHVGRAFEAFKVLRWYGLFIVWVVVVSLLAPVVYDGYVFLDPTSNQYAEIQLQVLDLAQVGFAVLGFAAVLYLAGSRFTTHHLLAWGFGAGMVLSFVRWLSQRSPVPWPQKFFDNSTSFSFVESGFQIGVRFRGIFPEPAMLATFSVPGVVYFVAWGLTLRGSARLWCFVVAGTGVVILAVSTSTTAIVAAVLVVAVIGGGAILRFGGGSVKLAPSYAVLAIVVLMVAVAALPTVYSYVTGTVDAKADTTSFAIRTAKDAAAWPLFRDSWGLGMGLGSLRPSSFIAMLLSSTGVIGTLLFVFGTVSLVRRSMRIPEAAPAVLAFVALLICKSIAGPDLAYPAILWVMIGVLAAYVIRDQRGVEQPVGVVSPELSRRARRWRPRPTVVSADSEALAVSARRSTR